MKVCHFCGSDNEDWMKICQQCGNPIIDTSSNKKSSYNEYENNNYESYDEKPKKSNMDLIITLGVLAIILVALISYTVYVCFIKKEHDNSNNKPEIVETKYDNIIGYSWMGNDDSLLSLYDDYAYSWYESKDDLTDNYLEGTYELYNGEEAIKYISEELKEYNLTEEEQRQIISSQQNATIDDYYVMILKREKMTIDGVEQESKVNAYYFGFIGSDAISFVNMDTTNYANFTKSEKVS